MMLENSPRCGKKLPAVTSFLTILELVVFTHGPARVVRVIVVINGADGIVVSLRMSILNLMQIDALN